jgi:hypothetical protein
MQQIKMEGYTMIQPKDVRAMRGEMTVKQAAKQAMVAERTWRAWEQGTNGGKPLLMPEFRKELFLSRGAANIKTV